MSTTTTRRASVQPRPNDTTPRREALPQQVGGAAALYAALALLAAIPYFLLVVDYPGASTAADKVSMIGDHYPSLYAMYVVSYVLFGLAIGLVALAVWDRLRAAAPLAVRAATGAGLLWSVALVSSGLVFTYGMTTVDELAASDRAAAVTTWRAVEPVALALGGAGGELLGGLFVLLVSLVVLRAGGLPKALAWLGVGAGAIGLASVVPPLHDLGVAFGLLQIVWLTWLGVFLLRAGSTPLRASTETTS